MKFNSLKELKSIKFKNKLPRNSKSIEKVKNEDNQALNKCLNLAKDFKKILIEQHDNKEENYLKIKILAPRKTPKIPEGYFFKGGVAREVLNSALNSTKKEIPFRDIDLIRFADLKDSLDHDLSIKHMYADYCFGRGVEVVENINTYFKTRDLTINEVLYYYPYIYCSFDAFLDLFNGEIRASKYRTDNKGVVDPKTAIKMLRLFSEYKIYNYQANLNLNDKKIVANDFDLALQLKRSYESREGVIEEFIELCFEKGLFNGYFESPPAPSLAIKYLASRIKQGLDFFTDLPEYIFNEIY